MKEKAQEDRRNDLFAFVFFCFLFFSLNVHSSISKISLLDDRNIMYKRREKRSVTFCFFVVVVVVFIIYIEEE